MCLSEKIVLFSLFYYVDICSLQPSSGLNTTNGRLKIGKANKPNVNSYETDVYCQNRSMVMFLTCFCPCMRCMVWYGVIFMCMCISSECIQCLIHLQSWLCSMCGNKNSGKWIYLSFESCYLVLCYIIAYKKSLLYATMLHNGKCIAKLTKWIANG